MTAAPQYHLWRRAGMSRVEGPLSATARTGGLSHAMWPAKGHSEVAHAFPVAISQKYGKFSGYIVSLHLRFLLIVLGERLGVSPIP